MKNSTRIGVTSELCGVLFEWLDFDGDDCFSDFHIIVSQEAGTRRFDFGPCVVSSLRRLAEFFTDQTQLTVGGGFQHPDIRYYDVHREHDGYCLAIRFENEPSERFHIPAPLVQIDDGFLGHH